MASMAAVFGIAFALGFRSGAGLMQWLGAAGLLGLAWSVSVFNRRDRKT